MFFYTQTIYALVTDVYIFGVTLTGWQVLGCALAFLFCLAAAVEKHFSSKSEIAEKVLGRDSEEDICVEADPTSNDSFKKV